MGNFNLIQYLTFRIDKAIEMLMDRKIDRIDVVLYPEDIKGLLNKTEKEIVDGDFKEVEIREIEDRRFLEWINLFIY